MRLIIVLTSLFIFCTVACEPKGPNLEEMDLLSQGLPLKIKTPEGVEVVSNDMGIMKDVTIKNDVGYSIQIFESEAKQLDAIKVVADLKNEIEQSKYFSKFIMLEENGFVFEKKVGEDYINYDFRHVKVLGAKQYVIQVSLSGKFTLDQVKLMYKSVQ